MIHLFKSAASKAWGVAIVILAVGALGLSAVRLMLPQLSGFQVQLKQLVAARTGLAVQLGSVEARQRGLTSVLVLRGLSLSDPRDPEKGVELKEVQIDLDLLRSLFTGRLSIGQAVVRGARLVLTRAVDGRLSVFGVEGIEATGNEDRDIGSFFLSLDRLRLVDSELTWIDHKAGWEPVRFGDVQLLILNDGDRHQLDIGGRVVGQGDARVGLRADFMGTPGKDHEPIGDLYLRVDHLSLRGLLAGYPLPDFAVQDGRIDAELWLGLAGGQIDDIQGWVDGQGLDLSRQPPGEERRSLKIAGLGGRMFWQRQPGGWQLDVAELRYQPGRTERPGTAFSLHLDAGPDRALRGGIGELALEDLVALLGWWSPDLAPVLPTLQPRADLHDLQFSYDEAGDRWGVHGRVSGLHSEPGAGIPGVSGLDLSFWAGPEQGTLDLESHGGEARFPGLFREPLRVDGFSGRLRWRWRGDGALLVEAANLHAFNSDIDTRTRLSLLLPGDDSSPFLDLQTDFRDGVAATTPRYLPVGIMAPAVVDWLDQAFVSGRVLSGSALVRGDLGDFPFPRDQGRFEVLFDVEDLVLEYMEGWPRLEELAGEVRFLNQGLELSFPQGYLLQTRLLKASGRIVDLARTTPLILEGELEGPFSDGLQILSTPPLRVKFGPFVDQVKVSGQVATRLHLRLPIDDGSPLRVSGRLTWKDAAIRLKEPAIGLSQFEGRLGFTQDGLQGTGIHAQLFDSPVVLDLNTLAGGEATRISARGRLGMERLARRWPGTGLEQLQGSVGAKLQLEIPHQPDRVRLLADLDLTEVAVDLPPPLGKSAGVRRLFELSTEISESPNQRLDLQYGDQAAAFVLSHNKLGGLALQRGSIRFGGGRAELREGPGLWLEGSLDALNLDGWNRWWREQGPPDGPVGRGMEMLNGLDLEIGTLQAGGYLFEDVGLDIRSRKRAWSGRFESNVAAGTVSVPRDFETGTLVSRVQYLDLPAQVAASVRPEGGAAVEPDPRRLPALDLNIDELRVGARNLGRFELRAERIPSGLYLPELTLERKYLEATGSGHWIVNEAGQESELTLAVETPDLGKLMKNLGFPKLLKQAATKIDANLSWPGPPAGFSLQQLSGSLAIEMDKGQLLDVSPGFGRVFGLVNLGALGRRLSLDFSDLFRKGFGFDRFSGSFALEDGNALTEDTVIEGPAARLQMSGRTGLVNHDYDQLVKVTPHVSTSIPVAGALAGGPVVGAALLLAQQLIGKNVDKISSYRYTVTGSWDDPVITPEESGNGGESGSGVEKVGREDHSGDNKPNPVSEWLNQ